MRMIRLILAVLVVVGFPTALAHAQSNSAVDEYSEGVPGGGGERPGSGAPEGAPLPSGVAQDLQAAGQDGAAAAALAERSGGPGGSPGGSITQSNSKSDSSAPSSDKDGGIGSVISEVLDPDSDSGMGIVLPIVLGLSLLAAVAFGIARLRSTDNPA